MTVRVFTLHLDPETDVFDDGEVRAFGEQHEVPAVREHLLHQGSRIAIRGRPARTT